MREYDIYIIRKDIANDYYGLEGKLFHLFEENRFAKGELKQVTTDQINYIIEPINLSILQEVLVDNLSEIDGYDYEDNKHFIRMKERDSQAGLYLDENHLTLFSEGTFDAEACFFEVLRSFHSYFIAMEFDQKRYGWLKPVKALEMVQQPS
ncbi:MAG: sporulation inhibitor of replication protein SirA [Bacillus sp. (in: Bacteria)]|nr:sporulation inhibitor of replication protein SirA [Bacillus sp. (in: firmicutes)]